MLVTAKSPNSVSALILMGYHITRLVTSSKFKRIYYFQTNARDGAPQQCCLHELR
jgi:hypothetical protein